MGKPKKQEYAVRINYEIQGDTVYVLATSEEEAIEVANDRSSWVHADMLYGGEMVNWKAQSAELNE